MHIFIGIALLVAGACCFHVAMGIMTGSKPDWVMPRLVLGLALSGLAAVAVVTGMEITRHHAQYNPIHVSEELANANGLTLDHKTVSIEINEPGTDFAATDTTYSVEVTTALPTYASAEPVMARLTVSASDFPRISHSLIAYRNGWLVFMVPNRSPARYFRPANILDSCRAELNER